MLWFCSFDEFDEPGGEDDADGGDHSTVGIDADGVGPMKKVGAASGLDAFADEMDGDDVDDSHDGAHTRTASLSGKGRGGATLDIDDGFHSFPDDGKETSSVFQVDVEEGTVGWSAGLAELHAPLMADTGVAGSCCRLQCNLGKQSRSRTSSPQSLVCLNTWYVCR